jgi:hypothetical protein
VISVGLITPHAARGPAEEFELMAPGAITTRVVQVPAPAQLPCSSDEGDERPTTLFR